MSWVIAMAVFGRKSMLDGIGMFDSYHSLRCLHKLPKEP